MLSVNTGKQSLGDVAPVRVSASRMPRTVHGSKGEETGGSTQLRNEELHNLQSVSNISEKSNQYFSQKTERKETIPRPRCR